MWQYTGKTRPDFAIPPGPSQESVWDYPRPPQIVNDHRKVAVLAASILIAESKECLRVLETASPPTWYIPVKDVHLHYLREIEGDSICEWKGKASYFELLHQPGEIVGWQYRNPTLQFQKIADCISFYPGRLKCYVDGESVQPQPGFFYGGWVTKEIVGPYKGMPGTSGW
ncbi:MAG: DUF427 domain-containing protein [Leptospiraceae bacterium]|nr:DUF427 domain-containing protein [Leptospiraceae bacterium]